MHMLEELNAIDFILLNIVDVYIYPPNFNSDNIRVLYPRVPIMWDQDTKLGSVG
jgi:hypothetical protein